VLRSDDGLLWAASGMHCGTIAATADDDSADIRGVQFIPASGDDPNEGRRLLLRATGDNERVPA
jgi:hypothetical protein